MYIIYNIYIIYIYIHIYIYIYINDTINVDISGIKVLNTLIR